MSRDPVPFSLTVEATRGICPVGEKVARHNRENGKIPVFSCEGACIRGEVARVAANLVAKQGPYRRGCHGELFTVPDSAMAGWASAADQVVVIDGCFLRCHARVMRGLIAKDRLVEFDALSRHGKYSDTFDIDSVPELDRNATAHEVADWVLESLQACGQRHRPGD